MRCRQSACSTNPSLKRRAKLAAIEVAHWYRPSLWRIIDLVDASLMPSALELACHPRIENRERFLLGDYPLSDGEHVGVVVGPTEAGRFRAPAQAAPHAAHAIGHDRLAVPGAAQHDSPLELAAGNRFSDRPNEERIVDWVG